MNKEYRIVATEKRGVFRCFGTDRAFAEATIGIDALSLVFPGCPSTDGVPGVLPSRGKLQWRDDGIQGNDSTWTDYTPEEHQAVYVRNIAGRQERLAAIK